MDFPIPPLQPSLQDVLQPMFDDYSAAKFVRRLASFIEHARLGASTETDCVVEVILHNGEVIRASSISAEGANALRIEGTRNGEKCLMFCNHSSLQLLCSFPLHDIKEQRPKIGFYVADKEVSSGQE